VNIGLGLSLTQRRGGGGGVPVEPPQLAKLSVWYKADEGITLNATDVAAWANQGTAGGSAAQGTAANQPLYVEDGQNGLPVIRFNGTTDFLSQALLTLPSRFTIIVAGKFTNAKDLFIEHGPEAINNPGFFLFGDGSGGLTSVHRGGTKEFTTSAANAMGSAWATFGATYNGDWSVSKSGTAITVTPGGDPSVADSTLEETLWICSRVGTSFFSDGDLGEILIWDDPLSAGDFAAAEDYLGARWGVAIA
jgi:hypothetical protein